MFFIVRCYRHGAGSTLYPAPAGQLGTEKIAFPINFAPNIPFKGNEEIRFTPGWGNSKSEEYWSYTFLWFIDGAPVISADNLKQYLTLYYNGLYLTNQKKDATADTNFSKVEIRKITTAAGDIQTFEGTIATLNFLTKTAFNLNARIHIRSNTTGDHSALLIEISPQDYEHTVWGEMDKIVSGFGFKAN